MPGVADSEPVVLMWSGGKDAALALHALNASEGHHVVALLTTVHVPDEIVTMHHVPLTLIEAQATSIGLPLHVMRLEEGAPNTAYEAALERTLAPLREKGIQTVASGDLFLEDLRAYREGVLDRLGLRALFPLWRQETRALARRFIAEGFRALVVSVDAQQLDPSFAGRPFDEAFLRDLPVGVDPCGENGEFHTFVFEGPSFQRAIPFEQGKRKRGARMHYVPFRSATVWLAAGC